MTIKKDVWTKPYLLCELQDELVNFDGDSGAIGRFTIGNDKLEIDLKGRYICSDVLGGPSNAGENHREAIFGTAAQWTSCAYAEHRTPRRTSQERCGK